MNTEPELPRRMRKLPIDPQRGYVVPWFVAMDERGQWDFRLMDAPKFTRAIKERLCWLCGESLGHHLAFVIGPMCAITRTTSEPPCHRDCAEFAVKVCPFLLNPHQKRNPRETHGEIEAPGGIMNPRNPGVSVEWICGRYDIFLDPRGAPLLRVSDPSQLICWAEGRTATQRELFESIESGFPSLLDLAKEQGDKAVEVLFKAKDKAYRLFKQHGCIT